MRPLTRSYFFLLPLERPFLLSLPHLLGTCLPLMWSTFFHLHAPALIPSLSLTKLRLLLILRSGTLDRGSFPFCQDSSGVLANCSLSVALTSLFTFQQAQYAQVFSAEACAILQALCWSRQHQQVCHFSYPTLVLSFPFTSISLERTVFSSGSTGIRYNGCPNTRFSREQRR